VKAPCSIETSGIDCSVKPLGITHGRSYDPRHSKSPYATATRSCILCRRSPSCFLQNSHSRPLFTHEVSPLLFLSVHPYPPSPQACRLIICAGTRAVNRSDCDIVTRKMNCDGRIRLDSEETVPETSYIKSQPLNHKNSRIYGV